jgi:hypothetical protein
MVQGIETLQPGAREAAAPQQIPQEAVDQLGQAFSSLSEEEIQSLRELSDDLKNMSQEELTAIKQVVDFLIRKKDQYDTAVQAVIRQGMVEPGDLPPDYDPVFFDILSKMIDDVMKGEEPQQFARGGIASLNKKTKKMASAGRYGDTMLAHLSPESAKKLKDMGGSGTINPETGLREYGLFSSIGSFFKKAVGAVLPIALSMTPLGPIFGAAIGSGIGAMINGANPGQALTAGLMGGVGGALYSGVSGAMSNQGFMSGVSNAFTGGVSGIQGMLGLGGTPTAGAPAVAPSISAAQTAGGSGNYMSQIGGGGAAAAPGMLDTARNWISNNPLTAAGIAGLGGVALASAMQPEEKAQKMQERNVEPTRFAPGTFQIYQAPKVNVVPTYSPAYAAQGGEIDARRGGHMSGPGTGTSDDIPARLSDGEFVMTAAAVRGAGDGSRMKGAKRMYDMMHKFEKRA